MSYLDGSIREIHQALVERLVTPFELAKEAIERAKANQDNAFELIDEEGALAFAKTLVTPEEDNLLWGIPYCAKDNLSIKGLETTASSAVLEGYVPCFDATVIAKLKERKCVLIGKTTMDELAMGGTGTTGHKGITYNPYDATHIKMIGGSSSGSAVVTACGIVPFALGSDTGDSVRKPASYGGVVGFKPTWGRISRFGLFPFAASLDHVGYFTRNVEDASILLSALSGRDENDSTSSDKPVPEIINEGPSALQGKHIAILTPLYDAIDNALLRQKMDASIHAMRQEGAIVDFVDFPLGLLQAIHATYLVISSAEATSNNANLDGIKFGPFHGGKTYQEVMFNARSRGFSKLIKRRFVIGSFVLMRENQDELFLRAQKVRAKIVDELHKIYRDYDVIYAPAAPSIAPDLHAPSHKLSDDILDNHLVLGNFAGLPSITVPLAMEDGYPLGVNVMGRAFEENTVLEVAMAIERITGLKGLSTLNKKEGRL